MKYNTVYEQLVAHCVTSHNIVCLF